MTSWSRRLSRKKNPPISRKIRKARSVSKSTRNILSSAK